MACYLHRVYSLCRKHLLQVTKTAPRRFFSCSSCCYILPASSPVSMHLLSLTLPFSTFLHFIHTVSTSIMHLRQLCLFILTSCISSQQCLHFAICIYENTIAMDNSKNSVAVCSGSCLLSFNGFCAPEEIIFFAYLEAKTLLFLWWLFA